MGLQDLEDFVLKCGHYYIHRFFFGGVTSTPLIEL